MANRSNTASFHMMMLAVATLLLLQFISPGAAWTSQLNSHKPVPQQAVSRRAFWNQGAVSTTAAAAVLASVVVPPAFATETSPAAKPDSKNSGDQKTKQQLAQEQKEARRMAEETKKRLAVGRIGTI